MSAIGRWRVIGVKRKTAPKDGFGNDFGIKDVVFLQTLIQPIDLAERVGFEPTVDLHLRLISSQVHSTTLPPLHSIETIIAIESPLSRPYRAVAPWGS